MTTDPRYSVRATGSGWEVYDTHTPHPCSSVGSPFLSYEYGTFAECRVAAQAEADRLNSNTQESPR